MAIENLRYPASRIARNLMMYCCLKSHTESLFLFLLSLSIKEAPEAALLAVPHLGPVEICMASTAVHRVAASIFLNVYTASRTFLTEFLDCLFGCAGGYSFRVTPIIPVS